MSENRAHQCQSASQLRSLLLPGTYDFRAKDPLHREIEVIAHDHGATVYLRTYDRGMDIRASITVSDWNAADSAARTKLFRDACQAIVPPAPTLRDAANSLSKLINDSPRSPRIEELEKVLREFIYNGDTRLARAAPDLLEAVRQLHDGQAEYCRINLLQGYDNHDMKLARAALHKATGETVAAPEGQMRHRDAWYWQMPDGKQVELTEWEKTVHASAPSGSTVVGDTTRVLIKAPH